MKYRPSGGDVVGTLTVALFAMFGMSAPILAQLTPAEEWETPRTPWGDPDLQGIWDSKSTTPLQRPEQYADREFLTDDEIAALESAREREAGEGPQGRDVRAETGTEADVEGAYNNIFSTALGTHYSRTKRTSLIADPPDGRLPPLTPEAEASRRQTRETATTRAAAASRADVPYPVDTGRSYDNPEDVRVIERCQGVTLPCTGGLCGYSRLVQGPESVAIYYEQGHGGGGYRSIPWMDGRTCRHISGSGWNARMQHRRGLGRLPFQVVLDLTEGLPCAVQTVPVLLALLGLVACQPVQEPGDTRGGVNPVPHAPVLALGALGGVPPNPGAVVGGPIPYRPEALSQRDENRSNALTRDPLVKCLTPGVPRATYLGYPFQITQGIDKIMISYGFSNAGRTIHLDDVDAPGIEAWMGYSVGRWEGDTLVVEVTDLNGDTWFDRSGNYHSRALRVTERYTPITPYHIQYEATIDDPDVFTEPWTISLPLYRRMEEHARVLEYRCVEMVEELIYGHLRKEPLVEHWEGDYGRRGGTLVIDITRRPTSDPLNP